MAGAGDVDGDGAPDVIVGVPFYDTGAISAGAAFVFAGSPTGIASGSPAIAKTELLSHQTDSFFGKSVAGAGDVDGDGYADVIVGAPGYMSGAIEAGAAFVFRGGPTGIADADTTTAAAELGGDQENAYFGESVAGAGDVNGDGYADVIVGAKDYTWGVYDGGAAFVFLGGAAGIANGNSLAAATRLESNEESSYFGESVAGAGDVNGDGYADVIVGAPYYTSGGADKGAAFVFLGSATGVADGNPATAATRLESNEESSYFGGSVAAAGDVNGDGYADVIVGSRLHDIGTGMLYAPNVGAAYVFHGGTAGIADGDPSTATYLSYPRQASSNFGVSVAGAGDVNGDGYADVIVGADRFGVTAAGAAYVFHGSVEGIIVCRAPSYRIKQMPASAEALPESGTSTATVTPMSSLERLSTIMARTEREQPSSFSAAVALAVARCGHNNCAAAAPPPCSRAHLPIRAVSRFECWRRIRWVAGE